MNYVRDVVQSARTENIASGRDLPKLMEESAWGWKRPINLWIRAIFWMASQVSYQQGERVRERNWMCISAGGTRRIGGHLKNEQPTTTAELERKSIGRRRDVQFSMLYIKKVFFFTLQNWQRNVIRFLSCMFLPISQGSHRFLCIWEGQPLETLHRPHSRTRCMYQNAELSGFNNCVSQQAVHVKISVYFSIMNHCGQENLFSNLP